jgi:transcriptional regulator with XRE-family HTH domain
VTERNQFERLGHRVAELRRNHRLTQQQMADRLAISRVAVSHLESGITQPSERTVILIAGLFKFEPWQLVSDTDYPSARAERLPAVVTRYTQAEHLVAIIDALVDTLADLERRRVRLVLEPWRERILAELESCFDDSERALLLDAVRRIDGVLFS